MVSMPPLRLTHLPLFLWYFIYKLIMNSIYIQSGMIILNSSCKLSKYEINVDLKFQYLQFVWFQSLK